MSIQENIDSIRLQKQLSEKNVALAVLQERLNHLTEVPFPFPLLPDLSDAAPASCSLVRFPPVLSRQTYETQLEEVGAASFRASGADGSVDGGCLAAEPEVPEGEPGGSAAASGGADGAAEGGEAESCGAGGASHHLQHVPPRPGQGVRPGPEGQEAARGL